MHLLFTVTNDLSYDQRMQRICGTLAAHGYAVTLVGRALPHSIPLTAQPFRQHRLRCRFQRGFLFYAEYNLRLFAWLLVQPCDAICSIDLDTLAAGCLAALLRGKKRVFDAHEYFTQVPEVVDRPVVKAFWAAVARLCLPFYRHAYTVGPALAAIFSKKYGLPFGVVRNMPEQLPPAPPLGGSASFAKSSHSTESSAPLPPNGGAGGGHEGAGGGLLLYQGALNAGRGLETLLAALPQLPNCSLWLAGEGDLSAELRQLAQRLGVEKQVTFLGYVTPADLKALTAQAWLGLNLLENKGLSYYYSLANKFFDCVQALVPVLTMDFPEYRALNAQYPVAVLLPELTTTAVVQAIRTLQQEESRYQSLQAACREAREVWNWEKEQEELLRIWRQALA